MDVKMLAYTSVYLHAFIHICMHDLELIIFLNTIYTCIHTDTLKYRDYLPCTNKVY